MQKFWRAPMGAFRCAKGVNKMNVIIDLDKLTYGTLTMIGQDYGIKGFCNNAKEIEEYSDKVVEELSKNTERFKKEIKDAVINAVKSIKIDIIK